MRARDIGFDVTYDGIRMTAEQLVQVAVEQKVHCIGLSILSGSHVQLARDVLALMRAAGLSDIPVLVGGIIPAADEQSLKESGVAGVYTPKRFDISSIMREMIELINSRN